MPTTHATRHRAVRSVFPSSKKHPLRTDNIPRGKVFSRIARLSLRWIVRRRWRLRWLFRLVLLCLVLLSLNLVLLVFAVLGLLLDFRQAHLFAGFLPVFHQLFLRKLGFRGRKSIG